MKRTGGKILIHFTASLLVIAFWKLNTVTENYAWNPQGKELFMLDIALSSIFFYKTVLWLVMVNLGLVAFRLFRQKNAFIFGIVIVWMAVFYLFTGRMVNKKCAPHYYTVFQNQSVTEEYQSRPLTQAGYHIGPILTEKIADPYWGKRSLAIRHLRESYYTPATETLLEIAKDRSEFMHIRLEAIRTLEYFGNNQAKEILKAIRLRLSGPGCAR